MVKSFAELDTALDESGLFPKALWDDAYAFSKGKMASVLPNGYNLSEAMAELANLQGDADMARKALRIAGDAEMHFTLWAHDEGIEVAQANCARIMAIIEELENR